MLGLRAEAGSRPGGRGTCSLLRQRKVPKRKATPSLRPLRCAKGQTCVGAVAGCAAELAARLRRSARTTAASQITKHGRSDAHATPQPPRRRRSQQGVGQPNLQQPNSHTGHCCARPRLRSARRLRPRDRAERSVAKLWRVCRRTHALRELTHRSCPSGAPKARSEFCGAPRDRAPQVAPERGAGVADSRVALSLVPFFRRRERKELARRGDIPASALNPGMPFKPAHQGFDQLSPNGWESSGLQKQ
ncbi:hypothetical protein C8C93_1811 [Acidovorax sp. 93]|nr:hypothetical protein C8C93_1811 [Acidovorax sp. 93]